MTCVKVRYPTKMAAHDALNRFDAAAHEPGAKRPVRAYRCPHCRGWHVTSSVDRRFA